MADERPAVEDDGPVATITLDRPEASNTQTPATWRALADHRATLIPRTSAWSWSAAPATSFSSGLDRGMLSPEGIDGDTSVLTLLDMPDARRWPSIATWQRGLRLAAPPRPSDERSRRSGGAAGRRRLPAGAGLRPPGARRRRPVLGCGSRCSAWSPDLTGTKPLVDLVGYSRALEICATTRWVTADEAREIGLATAVVPSEELEDATADLVAAVTAPLYGAVTETKALLQSAGELSLDDQRLAEREAQVRRFRELASLMGQ